MGPAVFPVGVLDPFEPVGGLVRAIAQHIDQGQAPQGVAVIRSGVQRRQCPALYPILIGKCRVEQVPGLDRAKDGFEGFRAILHAACQSDEELVEAFRFGRCCLPFPEFNLSSFAPGPALNAFKSGVLANRSAQSSC